MSGGHQLQLAALWPWLLMATLQAGFGRTGLVLAAAVESERSAEQKAIIRVIPLKMDPTGKLNLTLEGVFAGVAEITPAEGKLMQVRMTFIIFHFPSVWNIPSFFCLPNRIPQKGSAAWLSIYFILLNMLLIDILKRILSLYSRRSINALFYKIICLFLTLVLYCIM